MNKKRLIVAAVLAILGCVAIAYMIKKHRKE